MFETALNIVGSSFRFFTQHFARFLPFIVLYFLFTFSVDLAVMMKLLQEGGFVFIFMKFLSGLLGLWVSVALILEIHAIKQNKSLGFNKALHEGLYETPVFVVKAFIFSFMLLGGFILLVIPGFYVLFTYYFAPYVCLLDPQEQKPFEFSKKLMQGHRMEAFLIAIVLALVSIILVGVPVSLTIGASKIIGAFITSFMAAIVMSLADVVTVSAYLTFKNNVYYEEPEN